MAALSFVILVLSVLGSESGVVADPLAVINPDSIPQCGEVNFHWTGGASPYFVTIGTTDNASISSVTAAPNIGVRNYTWSPVDYPAGTPFTFSVSNKEGGAQSPVLMVQPSSNSSCLDDSETASPSPSSTENSASTTTSKKSASTNTPSSGVTASNSPGPSSNSHVAVIAGVVIGVLVLLGLIVILLMIQRRRERRNHTSSKEELVRTFGPQKAGLDSEAERDIEEMAMPDPYVFRAVSRGQPSLAIETEDLSRHPSTSRSNLAPGEAARSFSGRTPTESPSTPNTTSRNQLKGERYLPNYAHSPQWTSPGGASGVSGRSGIQEEDIDRLAARMVAMMSAGRLSEQAWAPGARSRDTEDAFIPPPMYNDVARGGGNRGGKR